MSQLTCTLLESNVAEETEEASKEASEQRSVSELSTKSGAEARNCENSLIPHPKDVQIAGKYASLIPPSTFMPKYGLRGSVNDVLKALLKFVERTGHFET